jgi:hypothetical protein
VACVKRKSLSQQQTKTKSYGGAYSYVYASALIDAELYGGVLRVFGNPSKRITQKKLGAKILMEE